jgi:hypothetical protein
LSYDAVRGRSVFYDGCLPQRPWQKSGGVLMALPQILNSYVYAVSPADIPAVINIPAELNIPAEYPIPPEYSIPAVINIPAELNIPAE